MRISDWSSDVCSSDLELAPAEDRGAFFVSIVGPEGAGFDYTVEQIAVFLPVGFMEGNTGRLFRELSVALAGAVALSAFRSDERRVGKEWVSTCSSRWSPSP